LRRTVRSVTSSASAISWASKPFDDWRAIERAEFDRGRARQKVAEKFVRVSDMLAAIGPTPVEGEPP
jgi:hypothetical protein